MAWPRSVSLRYRLLLLVLLAAVPALAVIGYAGFQQRRVAAADAHREAIGLANLLAADQRRLILDARQLLFMLSQLDPVRTRDPQTCSPFLQSILARDERFANLGVIDLDGEIRCSAIPPPGRITAADRPYFQRAIASREFAVGDYQIGRITGQASLNFGYPLLEAEQPTAVVFAALPLTWMKERLAETQLAAGSEVMLLDPSLTVLVQYPTEEELVGRSIEESALARAIRDGDREGTYAGPGPDGVRRLYAIATLQATPEAEPAHLVVGIPTRVAYAAANRGLTRSLLTVSVVSLLVLGAAWWGGEVFVLRHVRGLLGATRRLTAGDLGARAPAANDRSELAELGHAFNEMAQALEERAREIDAHVRGIDRLNRVHALLSSGTGAVLRARSEEDLLREVSRIAVEKGGFPLAAVHRIDPGSDAVEVVAWAGRSDPEIEGLLSTAGAGEGLPLRAPQLREGRVVLVPETGDAHSVPVPQVLREIGLQSAAMLPLRVDGTTVGVITLFSAEPNFFTPEELRLLRDLAADASLGLQHLDFERRIDHLANHDLLTDLPNRNLFRDRLEQAIVRARRSDRRVVVLAVKIDRITELNAARGHHMGDVVLREIAAFLAAEAGPSNTVARLGSGEFGVVLTDIDEPGRIPLAVERILDRAPSSVAVDGEEVFVSLSIGAAIYPDDGRDAATLSQKATFARQSGSSEVSNTLSFYSPETDARAQEKRRLEQELRQAIERDQLVLLYQPVVDVRTRTIIGVESLLRWNHPELGSVSPAQFIPIAEESGLIAHLGEWIFTQACAQGSSWSRAGFMKVRINVNVSVNQLQDAHFVDRIGTILRETVFDPRLLSLGLEITESELMENLQDAVLAIGRFRQMGLAVYVDDFGTGYSSLSYLRQLPIDSLKIDTSFIRDLPDDRDAVAVVDAIMAMARALDLRVIAEGVETEEQFSLLKEMGCDAVQGFLFGRPSPPGEVQRMFGATL